MVTCGSQKFIGRGAAKNPFFSEESQGLCFISPFDPVCFQLVKKWKEGRNKMHVGTRFSQQKISVQNPEKRDLIYRDEEISL